MTDWQLKTIELTPDTNRLVPGDRVQLGFCVNNNAIVREHIWVRTCQVLWQGDCYFGVLEHDAKSIKGLTAGQRVKFWPKHVARVKRPVQGDIY